MSADLGRNLLLKRGSTVLGSLRTKTISLGKEVVDITTDEDDGYRTSLAEAGQATLDISGDGVTKTEISTFRTEAYSSTTTTSSIDTVEFPNGDTITGTFRMPTFEESGTYNDANTFSMTLNSSGEWTFTAASA